MMDVRKFYEEQLAEWPEFRQRVEQLKEVTLREFKINGFTIQRKPRLLEWAEQAFGTRLDGHDADAGSRGHTTRLPSQLDAP